MLKFKFGFKKQEPRESEARVRLQKELFTYNQCCEHGFPAKPTAMAYDHRLELVAIGTKTGGLKVIGQPGVEFSAQHGNEVQVTQIYFIPEQARLLTLLSDNSVHLWEVNIHENGSQLDEVREFAMDASSKLKTISTCCMSGDNEQLLMGTEGGNIHMLNLPALTLSDQIIYQDVVMQNVPDDFKVNPGAVETLAIHPTNPNKLLIGYNRGLIVLWDIKDCNADQTYNATQQLESLTWHRDGTQFMSAHADGSYIVWSTTDSTKPKEQPNTPYGPFPCKAINKIQWKNAKAEPYIVFSGGMPRPSYADRHTVSVVQGANQVVFDFTSRVIDFVVLSNSDVLDDPIQPEFDDPHSILVLAEEEMVAIDLTSEGWPSFRQPYLASLHSSAITTATHVNNVPEPFWNKIIDAGDAQMAHQSTRDWPVGGGKTSESAPAAHDLLLTGHEDGTVRFWDASTTAMKLIYKMGTAAIFGCDFSSADQSNADGEEEWPPFRKVGTFDPYSDDPRLGIQKITLCPFSETMSVGGTAGQVVVLQFDREEREMEVRGVTVNIVSDRDSFVWKGHDALSVVGGELKYAPGFQPISVVQLHPPAACTALAQQSEWQLVGIGTAHGFGLFDYSQRCEVFTKCTLNPSDLTGTGDSAMARRKSFKKSLRESFRRLRRRRSERKKKGDEKGQGEAGPSGEGKSSPSKTSPPASSPEGGRNIERSIEARPVDDTMSSMVRFLYFTDTFLINGQGHSPTIWAGTNGGSVLVCQITVPANDKRDSEPTTCQLGKEIHLKHRAPVLNICVIDRNAAPLPSALEVSNDRAKAPDMSGSHQVVIISEEQFKIFALPSLKPLNKFKLTAHEGTKVRKVNFVNFKSRSDENYVENDLVVLTNNGDIHVFTVPHLRRQMKTAIIRPENVSGIVSSVITSHGEGFYPGSPSEFVRFSLSTRTLTKPDCAIDVKPGLRPVLPERTAPADGEAVPVAPEVEPQQQEEQQAHPTVQIPEQGAAAAVAPEQASPALGSEGAAGTPEGGQPADGSATADGAQNVSIADSLAMGDLTIDSKDLTIDSVKVHLSEEKSSTSSSELIQTMSSRTVVTRTVVSETLEDGRVVSSETTTTTITGGDESGAAEAVRLSTNE